MGDPACHLAFTCLSCGRLLDDELRGGRQCPHCGEDLEPMRPVRPLDSVLAANFILYCDRWKETVAFYADGLGLERTSSNPWFVEFRLGEAAHVSIADASHTTVPSANGAGVTLSIKVPDLDMVHRLLGARGIECGGFNERFGSRVFDVHDPEGNRIEFWSPPT